MRNDEERKLRNQSDSTGYRAFALHMANPRLIPAFHIVLKHHPE